MNAMMTGRPILRARKRTFIRPAMLEETQSLRYLAAQIRPQIFLSAVFSVSLCLCG
jgi:hypothetical protein